MEIQVPFAAPMPRPRRGMSDLELGSGLTEATALLIESSKLVEGYRHFKDEEETDKYFLYMLRLDRQLGMLRHRIMAYASFIRDRLDDVGAIENIEDEDLGYALRDVSLEESRKGITELAIEISEQCCCLIFSDRMDRKQKVAPIVRIEQLLEKHAYACACLD